MSYETPCEKPVKTGASDIQGSLIQDGPMHANKSMRWAFPPLNDPPLCHRGELMLTSGSINRAGWEVGWAQAIGFKHQRSEDSMGIAWEAAVDPIGQTPSSCFLTLALADGVGGGARGDIASHAVVQHCLNFAPRALEHASLLDWLGHADSVVNRSLAAFTSMPGAATLAAAWFDPSGRGWITRVGDARLSISRRCADRWLPLLADQSYALLGEEPPCADYLNAPARMVGSGLMGCPDLMQFEVKPHDVLMLSSDGCHEWLDEVCTLNNFSTSDRLVDIARHMILHVRKNGSEDDISVLLFGKTPA